MINSGDILETIDMIQNENLDIRTVTMGISLLDCIDSDIDKACDKVYDKITKYAKSPYKFAASVLPCVTGDDLPADDFEKVELLSRLTGTAIPAPLAALQTKPVLHKTCCEKQEMGAFIKSFLN